MAVCTLMMLLRHVSDMCSAVDVATGTDSRQSSVKKSLHDVAAYGECLCYFHNAS